MPLWPLTVAIYSEVTIYQVCFLQLADCCFPYTMIRKLFFSLTLRLVLPLTDTIIKMLVIRYFRTLV